MIGRRPRIAVIGLQRQVPTALGVGLHVTCRQQFVDLIEAAGCLPLIIPPKVMDPEECLELVDGLVLPGGADLDPALYGERPHPATSGVDPERDRWELALVRAALQADYPLLGVCRGMQLLNVALGGTLCQHLADVPSVWLKHEVAENPHLPAHMVAVTPGSRLARALALPPGEQADLRIAVNSIHHQGIARPGAGLRVSAVAEDGVIEAIEAADQRFVLGVGWHPELLADPRQSGLFFALAAALQGQKERDQVRD